MIFYISNIIFTTANVNLASSTTTAQTAESKQQRVSEVEVNYIINLPKIIPQYDHHLPPTPSTLHLAGANLVGSDLYNSLKDYLRRHLATLYIKRENAPDSLLHYYSREWLNYTRAASYIHHIFRYLNRHWVKREMDEGHRNVYDINTVGVRTGRNWTVIHFVFLYDLSYGCMCVLFIFNFNCFFFV